MRLFQKKMTRLSFVEEGSCEFLSFHQRTVGSVVFCHEKMMSLAQSAEEACVSVPEEDGELVTC